MADNDQEVGANRRKPSGFMAETMAAAKVAAPPPVGDEWDDASSGANALVQPPPEDGSIITLDLGGSSRFDDDVEPEPAPEPKTAERRPLRAAAERPTVRPPSQDGEDHRARAARRIEELRGHSDEDDEGDDEFHIDLHLPPPDWTYEWRRRTVLNAEDPSYQVYLAQKGWAAVPARRHPEMMPLGYSGAFIERKGMILMERPTAIVEERKALERRKAAAQVRQKEAQLNQSQQGHFDRRDAKGNSLVKLGKSYEAMPIPED